MSPLCPEMGQTIVVAKDGLLTISIDVSCLLPLQSWRCLCFEANASPARWSTYEPKIKKRDHLLPKTKFIPSTFEDVVNLYRKPLNHQPTWLHLHKII